MKRAVIELTQEECEQLDYIRERESRSDCLRMLIATRYKEAIAQLEESARLYRLLSHAKYLLALSRASKED